MQGKNAPLWIINQGINVYHLSLGRAFLSETALLCTGFSEFQPPFTLICSNVWQFSPQYTKSHNYFSLSFYILHLGVYIYHLSDCREGSSKKKSHICTTFMIFSANLAKYFAVFWILQENERGKNLHHSEFLIRATIPIF